MSTEIKVKRSKEFWVGLLVLAAVALMLGFGWMIGLITPWSNDVRYSVLYNFAGGVEVGTPVRVSGVKVGKVERIDFLAAAAPAENEMLPATLKLAITVSKKASGAVREDSKFYVNMAGIIGERYIEISPGSTESPQLAGNKTVRGIDPPRIDQLISQGYGVFGRIEDMLEANEASVSDFLKNLSSMLQDANKFLKTSDRRKFFTLLDNLTSLTSDLKTLSKELNTEEAREIFKLLGALVKRAHEIDKPALKKFLQEEGVRARIF